MKKLNSGGFGAAVEFLTESARSLELARWQLFTGGGSVDSVLDELLKFQNSDGGFGHAMEPDMRATGSTVLATLEALEILFETDSKVFDPVRMQTLYWLGSAGKGYDADSRLWPYLPENIDRAPHAPWWNVSDLAENFGGFLVNPRARILAFFLHSPGTDYPDISAADIEAITLELVASVVSMESSVSPDTLRSLLSLHEALSRDDSPIDRGVAQSLEEGIKRMIPSSVERDSGKWGEYGLQPLEVASTPESRWLPMLGESVEEHLDYLVDHQEADGSWKPFWNWGGVHPEAWEISRREWSGVLTLRNLKRLKAFGRIGG